MRKFAVEITGGTTVGGPLPAGGVPTVVRVRASLMAAGMAAWKTYWQTWVALGPQ